MYVSSNFALSIISSLMTALAAGADDPSPSTQLEAGCVHTVEIVEAASGEPERSVQEAGDGQDAERPLLVVQAAERPVLVATATATTGEDAPAAASVEEPAPQAEEGGSGRVSEEARPLVEKVQSFYENTDDFTASFHQTYIYQVGRRVESRGTVAFKKPAMMRWDYNHPRERSFIVDGTDLWIWTPEDLTVVRQRGFTASDLSTSITFLWGEGRLEDEFHIELEGDDRLSLTPIRPESSFQKVIFKVDVETGRVLESTVVDPQGNRNHMVFSEMNLNAGLSGERFEFSLPAGADLQEMPELR